MLLGREWEYIDFYLVEAPAERMESRRFFRKSGWIIYDYKVNLLLIDCTMYNSLRNSDLSPKRCFEAGSPIFSQILLALSRVEHTNKIQDVRIRASPLWYCSFSPDLSTKPPLHSVPSPSQSIPFQPSPFRPHKHCMGKHLYNFFTRTKKAKSAYIEIEYFMLKNR